MPIPVVTNLVDDLGINISMPEARKRLPHPTDDHAAPKKHAGLRAPEDSTLPAETAKDAVVLAPHSAVSPEGLVGPRLNESSRATVGTNGLIGGSTFFVGSKVATRPIWCSRLRTLVPPADWWRNNDYEVVKSPRFAARGAEAHLVGTAQDVHAQEPGADWTEHNKAMMALDQHEELAWEVTGVLTVELRVYNGTLRELCLLSWKPCWIPLHWVVGQQGPQFEVTLRHHQMKWNARTERSQRDVAVWCTAELTRFIASKMLEDAWKPKLHKVAGFSVITDDNGKSIPMVKAVWAHSWEHSGHLAVHKTLWLRLLTEREVACRRLLKITSGRVASPLIEGFLQQVLQETSELVE